MGGGQMAVPATRFSGGQEKFTSLAGEIATIPVDAEPEAMLHCSSQCEQKTPTTTLLITRRCIGAAAALRVSHLVCISSQGINPFGPTLIRVSGP